MYTCTFEKEKVAFWGAEGQFGWSGEPDVASQLECWATVTSLGGEGLYTHYVRYL